jgi:hypothetical protein
VDFGRDRLFRDVSISKLTPDTTVHTGMDYSNENVFLRITHQTDSEQDMLSMMFFIMKIVQDFLLNYKKQLAISFFDQCGVGKQVVTN